MSLENITKSSRCIVLGPAGTGKSIFIKYLVCKLKANGGLRIINLGERTTPHFQDSLLPSYDIHASKNSDIMSVSDFDMLLFHLDDPNDFKFLDYDTCGCIVTIIPEMDIPARKVDYIFVFGKKTTLPDSINKIEIKNAMTTIQPFGFVMYDVKKESIQVMDPVPFNQ